MKKTALAAAITLGLVGCGGGSNEGTALSNNAGENGAANQSSTTLAANSSPSTNTSRGETTTAPSVPSQAQAPAPSRNGIGGTGVTLKGNVGAIVGITFNPTSGTYGSGTIFSPAACSGTLISPTHIITAKHCLPNQNGVINTNYRNFAVYFNPSQSTPNTVIDQFAGGSWNYNPAAVRYDVVRFKDFGWDTAILEVARSVSGAKPFKLGLAEAPNLNVGDLVINDAYGTTDGKFPSFGTLRTYTYKVSAIPTSGFARIYGDINQTWYYDLTSPVYLASASPTSTGYSCGGDSGSSIYKSVGGVNTVYGVISAGTCNANLGASNTTIVSKTHAYVYLEGNKWIEPSHSTVAEQIYLAYLGRPADPAGWTNVSNTLQANNLPKTIVQLSDGYNSNAAIRSLINSFASSAEFNNLYPTDTQAFVNKIYMVLFNRAPDAGGLAYWMNAINSGTLARAQAPLAIMSGALTNTSSQGLIDATHVGKKTAIATNFSTAINTQAEISGYSGPLAATTARNMLANVTHTTDVNVFQATVNSTLYTITGVVQP